MSAENECILVFGDNHLPYTHKHAFNFLEAVANKYNPTRIISTDDFFDNHAFNFHEINPNLASPVGELTKAISLAQYFYDLFPIVDLVLGNHTLLIQRRANRFGLPDIVLKPINEIFCAPKTWVWHEQLNIDINGERIFFVHGKSSGQTTLAFNEQASCVQGHFHSKFCVTFIQNSIGKKIFNAFCGCLIDDSSLSFAYNKMTAQRPILGCMVIEQGNPIMIPMKLTPSHKWTGRL